ncbi:MAG: M20 family metallopeptidase [Chloroflexi bacterium]|nr:M20 family metallopeptidase [Chloroflexota bacterium]
MTQVAQHLDISSMISWLRDFVRIPSVYLPTVAGANEAGAAQFVFDTLVEWQLNPIMWEVAPGRPNIVAELRGAYGAGQTLLMEGHTDVVTPGDYAAWQYDPFGAEIVDGKMYGRGTADMKGGVAAMLFAVRALQLAGAPFAGTIRLLIPVDEEGLMIGIKDIVAKGYANGAAAAIICEPEQHEVCIAQKGALRLKLESFGRVAHGAMPEEGVNALSAMIHLLNRVMTIEATLRHTFGEHPLLGKIYVSPTVARAPISGDASQINVLPDYCDAYLDIRTIPGVVHGEIVTRIEYFINEVKQLDPKYALRVSIVDDRPSTEISATHPLVQSLQYAHERVYGERPPYGGVPGSTDGTIIMRDAGVPVVVYGPGGKRIPHQPNEYVEINEVKHAAEVYIHAALHFLNTES